MTDAQDNEVDMEQLGEAIAANAAAEAAAEEALLDQMRAEWFSKGYAAAMSDSVAVVQYQHGVAVNALARGLADLAAMTPRPGVPAPQELPVTTVKGRDGAAAWYDDPSHMLRVQMNDGSPEINEIVALNTDRVHTAEGQRKRIHQLLDDTLLSHNLVRVGDWQANGRGFNRGWHCTVQLRAARPNGPTLGQVGKSRGYADPVQAMREADSTAERTLAQGRSVQGATTRSTAGGARAKVRGFTSP
jgi:hypothetical protein